MCFRPKRLAYEAVMPTPAQALALLMLSALVSVACSKSEARDAVPAGTGTNLDGARIPAAVKWRHEITLNGRALPVTGFCDPGRRVVSISATQSGTTCSNSESQNGDRYKRRSDCTAPNGTLTTSGLTVTGKTAYTFEIIPNRHGSDGPPSHMITKATRLGDC